MKPPSPWLAARIWHLATRHGPIIARHHADKQLGEITRNATTWLLHHPAMRMPAAVDAAFDRQRRGAGTNFLLTNPGIVINDHCGEFLLANGDALRFATRQNRGRVGSERHQQVSAWLQS